MVDRRGKVYSVEVIVVKYFCDFCSQSLHSVEISPMPSSCTQTITMASHPSSGCWYCTGIHITLSLDCSIDYYKHRKR